jgi:MinD superfamily P-loop ATPase
MSRIAIASGKGGTGKTLVSTSLAWLLARDGHPVAYVDADVEEPNGHLFLHPELSDCRRYARPIPELTQKTCSGCGECQRFCQFNAILALPDRIMLFPELCSSCGGCVLACPEKVLSEKPREIGNIETGTAWAEPRHPIRFLAATLDVGEARATPLIGGLLDRIEDPGIVLIDAPPGTSCNVMEIVREVDLVVLVTEPTPFGLHDLVLAVEMTRALGKPVTAVVNRSDLGHDDVQRYLESQQIEVAAEIPFRPEVAGAYAHGEIAAAASPELCGLLRPLERRLIAEASS